MIAAIRNRFNALSPFQSRVVLTVGGVLAVCVLVALLYIADQSHRKHVRAVEAWNYISSKNVTVHFGSDDRTCGMTFVNSNVLEHDLKVFTHIFDDSATIFPDVTTIDLNGSSVSEAAIREFQAAVPECRIIP